MARLLFTAMVAEARGKLNGNVFTRNKGGAVIRNKVTPINPSTSHQSLQRAYMSNLSKAWTQTLTDTQRQSWKAFGQEIGARNIFGNNLILSGMATFQRINMIILTAGGTTINTPPNNLNVPSILSLGLTANHTGPTLSVTFAPTPLVAPQGLYLFATPAVSAGISNVSNRLRFLKFYSAATSPLNILSDWQTRFGPVPATAGNRIGITAQVVDTTTGAISAATSTSTLVV